MFCKKGVLRNSAKSTGKHLSFNKVADLTPATLLKKSLWHRCFPANFAKFLRTPFFTEHLRGLILLQILSNQLLKKIVMHKHMRALPFIFPYLFAQTQLTVSYFSSFLSTLLIKILFSIKNAL